MNRWSACRHATRLALAAMLLAGVAGFAPGGGLAERIDAILAEAIYEQAHWGVLVVDANTGETLYERNAEQLFVPASTTKLFTVASAWHWLGADHRIETPLVRQGQVTPEGVLMGDLILVAAGDPALGGRGNGDEIAWTDGDHTYANGNDQATLAAADPLAGLDRLARATHAAGIRRIAGRVVVDDRRFESIQATGSGPSKVSPIAVNDNLIDVVVTPQKAGEPATIDWRPKTALYEVESHVATSPVGHETDVRIELAAPGKIVVVGRIEQGHAPLIRVQEVEDPIRFAETLLGEALERAGVEIDSSAAGDAVLPEPSAVAALPRVATLESAPFRETAQLILKCSHNLAASALPLVVASHQGRRSLSEGFRFEREFLQGAGVPIETISLGSGAGGSRADRVTPRATVALLRHMKSRGDWEAFHDALPILGVDGTLAHSVDADSPAWGRVRAKTGTLLSYNLLTGKFLLESKALAGYATTASGRDVVFAMFVNNTHLDRPTETTREGRTLGRLCEAIVVDE